MAIRWDKFLDAYAERLLEALDGVDAFMDGDSNPISKALKADSPLIQSTPGFSRMAVCRAAVLCQMQVFDRQGGPEGDHRPKALRRHWYAYFKSEVAQPLAMMLGDYKINSQGVREMNDIDWAGRLSVVYSELVDNGVTYKDLWVEDASRMIEKNWETLFKGLHLMICVEKDSLFADFKAASQAIGARALYSGKGKSSKAAIEKVLREAFGWDERWNSGVFNSETPLVILHISDYDYDGEAVIGPTFGEQSTRYAKNIIEARIGVNPQQVLEIGRDLRDAWYTIKVSNSAYQEWADEKAVYLVSCSDCGQEFTSTGKEGECPYCGTEQMVSEDATPHGFEVESMRTRDYYALIADALLRVIPFEYIVKKLREECVASPSDAADAIMKDILANNTSYQSLLGEFDRLNEIKSEFERQVQQDLIRLGEGHESDWEDEEDDPEPDDLRQHMVRAAGSTWGSVWRPFSAQARTSSMIQWIRDEFSDTIDDLEDEVITW